MAKRTQKSSEIPVAASQSCIAASMAKIIRGMVNPVIQHHCMAMLQVNNFGDVEVKIREILQHIDGNVLEEPTEMELSQQQSAKRKRAQKEGLHDE